MIFIGAMASNFHFSIDPQNEFKSEVNFVSKAKKPGNGESRINRPLNAKDVHFNKIKSNI